jgi:hypothetical protein
MSDPTLERKAIELERKLSSIGAELAAWKAESKAGGPLEKHHTQIRALDRTLTKLTGEVASTLATARSTGLLDRAIELEEMVLSIHTLWNFLRSKLALRYVPHFQLALIGAGELAWKCFEPAQDLMPQGTGREPPLIYFSGASTPLTLPRGMAFEEEVEQVHVTWLLQRDSLDALPVPIIGIPWFQVEHVPDLPIVAHEVGHDVEIDLRLTAEIEAALDHQIADVEYERQTSWYRWATEVFADVYGTLALGPAFSRTLFDFLAGTPETLAAETPEPDYPTTILRLLLSLAVLETTHFATEAEELRQAWNLPAHELACYERDIPKVVAAMVTGPYGGLPHGRLDGLVCFTRESQRQAVADASELLSGLQPEAADARTLVASARLAFDRDPARYVKKGADRLVLNQIKSMQGVGVRAGPPPRDEGEQPELAESRRDEKAGALMFELMQASIAKRGSR